MFDFIIGPYAESVISTNFYILYKNDYLQNILETKDRIR